jgi:hypothetical protein
MTDRPTKITFAEMREQGARPPDLRTTTAAIRLRSAATDGRTSSGCPVLSPGLSARLAAIGALIFRPEQAAVAMIGFR